MLKNLTSHQTSTDPGAAIAATAGYTAAVGRIALSLGSAIVGIVVPCQSSCTPLTTPPSSSEHSRASRDTINSLPLVFDIRPQSPQCQVIMKPSTPRKSRRRNQPGSAQPGPSSSTTHNIPVSDYESDAAVQIIQPTFQDPAQSTRGLPTLGDMNLRVLKRHLPTVQSYISMAHNTTVYEWDDKADSWGEPVFKGPLFVCDLYPEVDTDSGNRVTRACIFVINRMSLENLVLNLANVISCRQNDAEGQLLELSAVRPNGESVNWGLFIDQESVKETWAAIQGRWDVVRKTA